jgi:nitroreductase
MELLQAIYDRRSVREYSGEPVDDALLRKLIDAAVQAPSAINKQPWCFIVIKRSDLLADISDKAKAHMLRVALNEPHHRIYDMLSDPKFNIFYHAPVLVLIATTEPTDWAVEDGALAAQNLMLAAHEAGLGTCWIGFAQHWLGTPEGKAAIGLPASHVPIAPIIVGHPLRKPAGVPRKAPNIRWIEP